MSNILSALGEASRIEIIERLSHGSMHVSLLAKYIKLPIVNVSHHLGMLSNAKIVISERRGRYVYYQLNPALVKVTPTALTVKLPNGEVWWRPARKDS